MKILHYFFNKVVGAFSKFRKAAISFVMSVRSHGTTQLLQDGFLWKLIFEYIFEKSIGKSQFKFHSNLTRTSGTWHRISIYDNMSLNSFYN